MDKTSKIYVAGHAGMVGSAIVRELVRCGYTNIVTRTHGELDLTDSDSVNRFFESERPEYVFLAAAKVGGIIANNSYPADFLYENMMIEMNVMHAAFVFGVKKFEFLGSSCIYPKNAPQPMKEDCLLHHLNQQMKVMRLRRYRGFATATICVLSTELILSALCLRICTVKVTIITR